MKPPAEITVSRSLFEAVDKFSCRLILYIPLVFFAGLFDTVIEPTARAMNVHDFASALTVGVLICLFELFLYQFRRFKERTRTEKDQIAAENRKHEAMLSTVIQAISDLVFIKDLEGRHVLVNKAVEDFTGLSRQELLGSSYIPPDLAAACAESDKSPILTGKCSRAEERFLKNGEVRVLDTIKTPLHDDKGDIIGIVGISRDITERLTAEKERTILQTKLLHSQKMESLGHLAAEIAHDFNNIVMALQGYATILKLQIEHEFIDRILEASERAGALVKSLLAFSRKQNIETKPVNLNSIVRDFVSMLQPLIKGDICFRMSLSDASLTVMADKLQLERVLLNLAMNARDAMPGGGQLVLTTEPFLMEEDFISKYGYGVCGSYACLSISDTGIGIPEGEIKEIFKPFYTTKESGTGLGLAIVYGIIKQHNGYINVHSEPKRGTNFHVFLPLVKGTSD